MINNSDDLLKKISFSKENKLDLSADEDLSIAVMNLISIEEHFFFTAKKTGKDKYFDLLKETREIRKELMKKLVKNPEGELWCISKHLLAASMRVMEVGTKKLGQGNTKQARELFENAYKLYTLFWGLNLNVLDVGVIAKVEEGKLSKDDKSDKTVFGKLGALVKKAIDCCIE